MGRGTGRAKGQRQGGGVHAPPPCPPRAAFSRWDKAQPSPSIRWETSSLVAQLWLYSSALFVIWPLAAQSSSPGWPVKHIINGRHLITLNSRMPKFVTHLSYKLLFHLEPVQSDPGTGAAIFSRSRCPGTVPAHGASWASAEVTQKVKLGCPLVMAESPRPGCRRHAPRHLFLGEHAMRLPPPPCPAPCPPLPITARGRSCCQAPSGIHPSISRWPQGSEEGCPRRSSGIGRRCSAGLQYAQAAPGIRGLGC